MRKRRKNRRNCQPVNSVKVVTPVSAPLPVAVEPAPAANGFDPRVSELIEHEASDAARGLYSGMKKLLTDCVGRLCESPIEQLMLVALYRADVFFDKNTDIFGNRIGGDPARFVEHCLDTRFQRGVFVFPQAEILGYRVDFLLGAMASPEAEPHWVVVECDGHEWHERTKEQAEYDRKRDRALQMAGYRVFRFTGREIWRDPTACAAEVLHYLRPYRREL